jgi:hypothetical protein
MPMAEHNIYLPVIKKTTAGETIAINIAQLTTHKEKEKKTHTRLS